MKDEIDAFSKEEDFEKKQEERQKRIEVETTVRDEEQYRIKHFLPRFKFWTYRFRMYYKSYLFYFLPFICLHKSTGKRALYDYLSKGLIEYQISGAWIIFCFELSIYPQNIYKYIINKLKKK